MDAPADRQNWLAGSVLTGNGLYIPDFQQNFLRRPRQTEGCKKRAHEAFVQAGCDTDSQKYGKEHTSQTETTGKPPQISRIGTLAQTGRQTRTFVTVGGVVLRRMDGGWNRLDILCFVEMTERSGLLRCRNHPYMTACAATDAAAHLADKGGGHVIFAGAFRADDFHGFCDYTKTIMSFQRLVLITAFLSTCLWIPPSSADDRPVCAGAADRACIVRSILFDMKDVREIQWKDSTLRDLAGSLTYDGQIDQAIGLIDQIQNQDTQAMTIRMIGMTAALYRKDAPGDLKIIFAKLDKRAGKIANSDARAIAYTYIAMSQAFAGLDADAEKTALAMSNAALRHKAFGETAEIQAERGDLTAAMGSIKHIDTASFRNKAYQNVAEILMKKGQYDDALKSANNIDNPVKRAQVLQGILHTQEVEKRGPRNDMRNDSLERTEMPAE